MKPIIRFAAACAVLAGLVLLLLWVFRALTAFASGPRDVAAFAADIALILGAGIGMLHLAQDADEIER